MGLLLPPSHSRASENPEKLPANRCHSGTSFAGMTQEGKRPNVIGFDLAKRKGLTPDEARGNLPFVSAADVKIFGGKAMDLGLKDRVAIITGGSYGIGQAVAQHLVQEGAKVAICARHAEQLERTAKELEPNVLAVQADITQAEDIAKLFDQTLGKFARLDILVNNAGGTHLSQLLDLPDEAWQEIIDTNLFSVIRCSRLAIPHMKKQKWGRIINISSIFGKQPGTGMIDYNATKAAVISLTKTLADELAKDNVLVNAVCPGPVRTPLWQEAAKIINPQDPEGMIAGFAAANIPMGRFGRPEEIASLVTFLASERSSFITGAAYDIDGGMVKYMV